MDTFLCTNDFKNEACQRLFFDSKNKKDMVVYNNIDHVLIDKIVTTITDDKIFCLSGRIRSTELAEALSKTLNVNITVRHLLPKLMDFIIKRFPELRISKKFTNKGTCYQGLSIQKEIPTLHYKNKHTSSEIADSICREANWSLNEYIRCLELDFIKIFKDDDKINVKAVIMYATGCLTKHIYKSIEQLNKTKLIAISAKDDFEKSIELDMVLSYNDAPIYTNRIKSAEVANYAGKKLSRAITSYQTQIKELPKMDFIIYPDIDELKYLAEWLKSNSLYKTTKEMMLNQNYFYDNYESCVNYCW